MMGFRKAIVSGFILDVQSLSDCLRASVSLIVTKAYGSAWQEETVPEEMMADLKKNARGNLPIGGETYGADEFIHGGRIFICRKRSCV